jgi:hypothetical protein
LYSSTWAASSSASSSEEVIRRRKLVMAYCSLPEALRWGARLKEMDLGGQAIRLKASPAIKGPEAGAFGVPHLLQSFSDDDAVFSLQRGHVRYGRATRANRSLGQGCPRCW